MKSIMSILVLVSFFFQTTAYAAVPFKVDGLRSNGNVEVNGSVSVGTGAAPNSKAILDLTSTTKGILPPRMTTAQRTAISSPPTGLMVYDTDTLTVWQYNGTGWIEVGSGGTAGAQYNVIENFGFEATTYNEDWTASGGVVAEATGTNIIFGEKSATWDASASTQTFSYASLAIGQGYKNNNCEGALFIQTPSGTATHTLQVWDGTNVLASVTVYSTTTPREFSTGVFPCPSSGNWQLRLLANADEPLIAVDNAYLGLARNVGVANLTTETASYSPSWTSSGTQPTIGDGAITGRWLRRGDRIFAQVTVLIGSTTTLGTGDYYFSIPSICTPDSTKMTRGATNNDFNAGFGVFYDNSSASNARVGVLIYNTSTAGVVRLYLNATGTLGAGVTGLGGANDQIAVNIDVPCVGWAATQTVMPDAQGWYIDAELSGGNPSLGTSSVASYTELTNASLTLTPRSGSAAAGVMCSSTNAAATPTTSTSTCSAGSESVGINFILPRSGAYEACVEFSHNVTVDQAVGVNSAFQVVETPTNAQTITTEGGSRIVSSHTGMAIAGGNSDSKTFPHNLCGQFNWSAGTKGVRLMYEQLVGGVPTVSQILADASATVGQRNIRWRVRPITSQQQAMLANSVIARDAVNGQVTTINTVVTPSTTYTATLNEDSIWANTTGGAWTLTLPPAASAKGKRYTIMISSGSNILTIDPNASENICGKSTIKMVGLESIEIQSNGSGWLVANGGCYRSAYAQVNAANCTSSPCTLNSASTTGTSITRSTTGTYSFNYGNVFDGAAATPACVVSTGSGSFGGGACLGGSANTSDVGIFCRNASDTLVDSRPSVTCWGAR